MRRAIPLLAVVVLVLALAPGVGATSGTMIITSDTTLTEDHDASAVDIGIEFAADDVTLDCAGHTVSGGGVGFGIQALGHSGLTIKNCLVTAFSVGILIDGSSNTLRANTTYANGGSGVGIAGDDNRVIANGSHDNGDAGFQAGFSSGSILRDNRATGNGGAGFVFNSSPDSRLVGNIARANGHGFWFNHSGGSLIGNVARGNSDHGFVSEHLSGLELVGNLARGNGGVGILLYIKTSHVTLRGNSANDNREDGFSVWRANRNLLKKNAAHGNGIVGFALRESSSYNTLVGNVACHNTLTDALDEGTGGVGNVWRDNRFCTASNI